jgi:hypothetical protein
VSGRRLAFALPAASAGLLALSGGLAASAPQAFRDAGGSTAVLLSFVVVVVAFSFVGCLIALRRPASAIGWMLAAVGVVFAIVVASSSTSQWGLATGSLSRDASEWVGVPANAWVIGLSLIGIHIPLRLPDGRLPSPHWRWFSRATIVLTAVSLVGLAVQPGRVEGVAGTANPLGSETLKVLQLAFVLVIVGFAGGLAALVVRYRRAALRERVQLRWIALGGAVFLVVFVVTLVLPIPEHSVAGEVSTSIAQVAFAALPVAVGYAVLKHGLYDIDVVVRRTIVYGALTATLAGTYLGCVLLLQFVLSAVTSDSGLAVAGSTLAVAALFRPARARIQAGVDRRFYRRRYDARRTLDAFSSRLRDEIDLGTLTVELDAVVRETLEPAHVSVWLREPRGAGG